MSLEIDPVASDSTRIQGPKKRVNTNNQEMLFNYGLKDVASPNKGLVEIVTGKELPEKGLVDVAPPNKGLVEIITGKELPKMGLVDVAPPNKGLLQVIIDWFK